MEEKKTVLIVDDKQVNRIVIRKIIQDEYALLEAQNGAEALEIIDSTPGISAVLLDIVMPVMNGYEFMTALSKTPHHALPVIVITGESDADAEEKALDCGAIDFVSKPLKPQILLSRLRNAVMRILMVLLEKLHHLARFDTLTGLYNRATMFRETRRLLDEHPEVRFAFVRLDIDEFRLYNSAMGEVAGDKLLQYIADGIRLASDPLPLKVYGRVDADVFCACVPYEKKLLDSLITEGQKSINAYRDDYYLSMSTGVYIVTQPEVSVATMYTRASVATDQCKNRFDLHFAFYDDAMGERLTRNQAISNDMVPALEERQFVAYLQPKYDIALNRPCGAEALVRWMHPTKGLISPGDFIPVFEQNGFIAKLDYYMWDTVCALLHRWQTEGRTLLPVSVNMSRVSLYNPHVARQLQDLVKKYELDPKYLNLEVTESAYMTNPELMEKTIRELQDAGFVILMDDFGSGYSSLNTLKEINVDILKIDMKFMPNGKDNAKSEKILSSIVRMAGWLGMPVIAEGVETIEQKQFLESIGCGYVQGFYYAKPLPVPEYEALIDRDGELANDALPSSRDAEKSASAWSSDPHIGDMLTSIPAPVAVLEYSARSLEIVRTNKLFSSLYSTGPAMPADAPQLTFENDQTVRNAIEQVATSGMPTDCEFSFTRKDGTFTWMRMRVQILARTAQALLLCTLLTDITAEKQYEDRLDTLMETLGGVSLRPKMLIIDDQAISRDLLSEMFSYGFDIICAENGREGLTLLQKNAGGIAIVLLDMMMPEMDGRAFLVEKNRQKDTAGIPVVVISAESGSDVQLDMLRLGVNDYITKPFNREIALQRVRNVLEYRSRFSQLVAEYRKLNDEDVTAAEENTH